METLLRAALGIVAESGHTAGAGEEGSGDEPSSWPNRENTTEFEAISTESLVDDSEGAPVPQGAEDADDGDDIPWSGRDFAWE